MPVHPSQSILFQEKNIVCMQIFQFGNAWYNEAVSVTERIHKSDIELQQSWCWNASTNSGNQVSVCLHLAHKIYLLVDRDGCSLYRLSCQQGKPHLQLLTDPVLSSGIKESLLEKSATNANQGCFAVCASMIEKDGRQYSERDNISSEKQK